MMTLLLATAALGAGVETFPSCARVKAVAFLWDTAVVSAEDGACRYALDGSEVSALEAAELPPEPARQGDCEFVPRRDGLLRRCGRLADEVFPVGGFPVTSAAFHGGVLYAGTFGGGLRRMPSGERVAGVPDAVTALAGSPRGLLVGTDRGTFLFEKGKARALGGAGPADGHIVKLARGGGALWAAHFDRGLSRLQDGVWTRFTTAEGLPSDWVDDLAWDGQCLWGAGERGVFFVEDGVVKRPEDPRLLRPTTALAASSGTVLLGQAGRVVAWKNGVFTETAVPELHPQRLLADGGKVWLAGLDGLWELEGAKVTRHGVIDGKLPGDWVTALSPGPDGLLVGTYDAGLLVFGSGATLKSDAWVNPGALDRDGARLAVGENGTGLALWDGASWSQLGAADGLPGDDVSAVLFDGPHLWVGTRTGLARITH
ncbi:MAG: hypothetical protein SF051_01580 [Elusimicrobiota bacterium]|nr:hypothetical protein [Elusimicrobiota bacterium]